MAPFDPVAEYKAKTRKSAQWSEHARKFLPGGVTGNVKFYGPYPVYLKKAKGSHVWDLDGNEYIDYMLCFGPLILGHGDPRVNAAIRKQMDSDGSLIFGAPHEGEAKMAERLSKIFPCGERVRFTNSGLEATLHGLRVARGFKKKAKVAKFEGHYHGCYDQALISLTPSADVRGPDTAPCSIGSSYGTSEDTLENTLVLPFNDIQSTERLLKKNKDELAAVIMEPVQRGFVPAKPDFIKAMREVTEDLGIVLIFDEVMSGFRMEKYGGAQTTYGVDPDMTCLGKIIGGGLPSGAFIGKEEIMSVVDPITRPKDARVFHGGTFNGHPTVLAAGNATMDVLELPETYPYLNRISDRLRDGFNDLFARNGFDAKAVGPGSTFNVLFAKKGSKVDLDDVSNYRRAAACDPALRAQFDFGLMTRGLHFHPDKPFYTCTAHSDKDVDATLKAAEEVLKKMKAG